MHVMPTAALLGLLVAGPAAAAPVGGEAPDWLVDRFAARTVDLASPPNELDLDGVAGAELAVAVAAEGAVRIELQVAGTLLAADASTATAPATGAYARFVALPPGGWQALRFAPDPTGRPPPSLRSATLRPGEARLLRTVRADLDGAGTLACVRCAAAGERPALELEVLVLPAMAAPLPGATAARAPGALRSGVFTLFADAVWHHPAWGGIDLLTLERDRPSFALDRPRFRGDRSGAQVAEGCGFRRHLDLTRLPGGADGVVSYAWHERKADAIAGDAARVVMRPLVVLHASGEPQPGAWCIARDDARPDGADAWSHPACFTVESDVDGRVPLPLLPQADGEDAEVLAFTTGARAAFGRRRGTRAAAGETVVLLTETATTTVRVTPPLGRPAFLGLHVATCAALLELPADGVLRLPALGEWATLHLGSPFRAAAHKLLLAPDADLSIAAERLPAR